MAAGKFDIVIEEGSKFQLDVTWYDKQGNTVDITGWGAAMIVKDRKGGTTLIKADTNDYLLIDTGTDGLIEIDLPVEVTSNLDFSSGIWHLIAYPSPLVPDENVVRLLEGAATYSREL